jgi:hypothetical protein
MEKEGIWVEEASEEMGKLESNWPHLGQKEKEEEEEVLLAVEVALEA